ncbi:hypothetical protein [Gorillibacterium timonense]|uniref:hypothetical protein n=1 Tax=Gorillibacterium timonense TaxID=1689269 RepID=UPI00071C42C7|nr:hypothetical protein [Gorillibacterium timonense]
MFRSRKFLFGLGTGIMIGAILVQLSFIGSTAVPSSLPDVSPVPSPTSTAWTGEQLEKAAEEQGKVILTKEDYEQLQKPTATPTSTPTLSPTSTPTSTPTSSPEQAAESTKRYVYIYNGMSSNTITEYLSQAGVVQDRVAFGERLRDTRQKHKLVTGMHVFELNSDIDKVVAELTGT